MIITELAKRFTVDGQFAAKCAYEAGCIYQLLNRANRRNQIHFAFAIPKNTTFD